MDIVKTLAQEFNIKEEQVTNTIALIDEGNTIPFISRYRKEVTGSLDDATLRDLFDRLSYLRKMEERRRIAYVIAVEKKDVIALGIIKPRIACGGQTAVGCTLNQAHGGIARAKPAADGGGLILSAVVDEQNFCLGCVEYGETF